MSGIATIAIGLGTAAYGIYNSEHAKSEAKKLQNSRPKITDSPYLKDQLSLSESELSTGMSGEAKAAYESDMDRSLSTSLSAVLKGGGSPNNVGEIFSNNAQGRQRLALMKDNLRLAEIDRVSRSEDAKEQERLQQFQVNVDAPWKDAAQGVAQERAAANNEIWSGIGTAGSGIMKGMETSRAKSDLTLPTVRDSNAPLSTSNPNNINLANTGGVVTSPASNYSSIDPNSAPSLLDSLLANPM